MATRTAPANTHLKALQSFEPFEQVPTASLQWLLDVGDLCTWQRGDTLYENEAPIQEMMVLLQGEVQWQFVSFANGETFPMSAPHITGKLPFSRLATAKGRMVATTDAVSLMVPEKHFRTLVAGHYELTQALVHQLSNRVRSSTQSAQHNEKMMALGKLSAGLAHELNNPAAAIQRTSVRLLDLLKALPANMQRSIEQGVSAEDVRATNELVFARMEEGGVCDLSMLSRSQKEDEINDWLLDHAIANGEELAEGLVEAGFQVEQLDRLAQQLPASSLPSALHWMNTALGTSRLVAEIQEAGGRISELVASIKAYTHMDRGAEPEPVDLAASLRSVQRILAHKVKAKQIELVEDYAENLPHVQAKPGDLNQVWTNIMDNALDVLPEGGGGRLRLGIRPDGDQLCVEIEDNGPGIPPEILDKIFDPFFTTKEMGKGTGLGLDFARRIVERHNGKLLVESAPGRTLFTACLPVAG